MSTTDSHTVITISNNRRSTDALGNHFNVGTFARYGNLISKSPLNSSIFIYSEI